MANKPMTSAQVRQAFLDFFANKGHTIVASSSLVPDNDATLLFTNAGMVQFKDALALRENRGYTRAASCQRCVRAGGKHNDLDNVGYTARHNTFFEMLGNFSFGDYFKREAIHYAWEFLTDVLELPEERLWVSVHLEDDEAEQIWVNEIGIAPARVVRLGDDENFWTMGDTGPCGPSSEIFYDHGPEFPGGPPGSPDANLDRFIEIWNLVFTQFDRSADGTLTRLPKPCVDTGLGLERLVAVLQNVQENYEIDLFQKLLRAAAKLLDYGDLTNSSLKVIADHIRSTSFLIYDGVVPSNEGRGYVLRRIIRRALRHGHKLQASEPFFHKLVEPLCEDMGDVYPGLAEMRDQISRILLKEERQFEITLDQGMKILSRAIKQMEGKEIPGEVIFKLYDTFGFPVDLTGDIARERGLTLDMEGFESAMEEQRRRGRAASKFGKETTGELGIELSTDFVGYESLRGESRVVALYKGETPAQRLQEGDEGIVVLDRTPFYAEAGGQVGDTGILEHENGSFDVDDTVREGNATLHIGSVKNGTISLTDTVDAVVDADARQATVLNHSATHLLHAALKSVLGDHVNQRGSLVEPDRLRFDFSHFEPLSREQIRDIERLVNDQIRLNSEVQTELLDLEAAKKKGAMALFGEKYTETVRVLTMGDGFSIELCGGTHAKRTGDIGLFRMNPDQGIASGVRRIEAVTGNKALQHIEQLEDILSDTAAILKADRDVISVRLKSLVEDNAALAKEVKALTGRLASQVGADIADDAVEIHGVKVIVQSLGEADPKTLPDTVDQLKNKLQSGIVVLATVQDDKVSLIAGVTGDLTDRVQAGELVNLVANKVGGKGGGRPDMARAGGNDPSRLSEALELVPVWLSEKLGKLG